MDQKERSRGEEIIFFFHFIISNIKTKHKLYLYSELQLTVIFLHQGAKLQVQNIKVPPFVTKMDPIIGSENYAMEGPLPDIWFALQVDLVRIYTFK